MMAAGCYSPGMTMYTFVMLLCLLAYLAGLAVMMWAT